MSLDLLKQAIKDKEDILDVFYKAVFPSKGKIFSVYDLFVDFKKYPHFSELSAVMDKDLFYLANNDVKRFTSQERLQNVCDLSYSHTYDSLRFAMTSLASKYDNSWPLGTSTLVMSYLIYLGLLDEACKMYTKWLKGSVEALNVANPGSLQETLFCVLMVQSNMTIPIEYRSITASKYTVGLLTIYPQGLATFWTHSTEEEKKAILLTLHCHYPEHVTAYV